MIIRDRPGPFELLFAMRGSILPRIFAPICVMMAIATAMVWLDRTWLPLHHSNATPFAVFGIALSLFLGFRNNAAYDRWWEARKLWGSLLADLRSLARETDLFIADRTLRQQLLQLSIAFLHLHRLNLRKLPLDEAAKLALAETDLPAKAAPPDAALNLIAAKLATALQSGAIDGFGARTLSQRLGSITLNQAGCERIATTPLPYVYSLLIFRTSYLYCLLLPLSLFDPAGFLTPLFGGIVAYVFFGLAEVSEELSHPFGNSVNSMPLDAICRAVEISMAPHLGKTPPEPMKPINYYLS